MSYLAAPVWPMRVVAVEADDMPVARGRSAEFRHAGVALTVVPTPAAALVAIGHDSGVSGVLVPIDMTGMALDDFVDIVHAFGRASVIIGIASVVRSEPEIVTHLRERGPVETIVMPASPHRLAAALKTAAPPAVPQQRVYRCGDLELDADAFRVLWHGQDVRLSPSSFELLQYLMAAYPRTVTMQELVSEFVPAGTSWRSDSVRSRIRHVREGLLAAVPDVPQPIKTVTKIGYRIVDANDVELDNPISLTSSPTRATTSSLTRRTNSRGLPIGSASAQSM